MRCLGGFLLSGVCKPLELALGGLDSQPAQANWMGMMFLFREKFACGRVGGEGEEGGGGRRDGDGGSDGDVVNV